VDTTSTPPDVKQFQRWLNDLVAILALPALWTDLEPRQIAQTLIDGLVKLLDLEFAYIRMGDSAEGSISECVRSSLRRDIEPHDLAQALERCLATEPPTEVLVLPNPVGDGLTSTAVFRLGLDDEVSRLIVGSQRPDFPTGMEQLLVRVAVNQAVVGLQEGRHLSRQRRAAEVLDRSLTKERAARLEAEKATNLRDEVLAILAHDLRNPMNSILSAASLLALTSEDGATKKPLAVIERATRTMQRLVNDLLDIARIEGGNFVMQTAPVEIGELIRESVELFEPQALATNITLRVAVDDGLPPVPADRDRLLQVFSNLFGNALKFSTTGKTITARATRCDGGVHVSIKDSGAGIPAEDLERVFDRFWQADRSSRAGAGLGLAICKAIIEAHGGTIWAASAVGRGTTMHFEIPERATLRLTAAGAPQFRR
jgi:signal transduction histidine kinase